VSEKAEATAVSSGMWIDLARAANGEPGMSGTASMRQNC